VTFLEELGRRDHVVLLAKVSGRVRFDLVEGPDTDPWLLTIDEGAVTVSHRTGSADCTVRGERSLFDQLVSGQAHMMSAVLRGALACTGDVDLVIAIQRIFPGQTPEPSATGDGESAR